MSILIVTHSNDNDSVARVVETIARKGGHTIRFDTDRYPIDVHFTAYYGAFGDERLTLTNEDGEFDLREVTAIWHRRLNFGARLPAGLDGQLRHASSAKRVLPLTACSPASKPSVWTTFNTSVTRRTSSFNYKSLATSD